MCPSAASVATSMSSTLSFETVDWIHHYRSLHQSHTLSCHNKYHQSHTHQPTITTPSGLRSLRAGQARSITPPEPPTRPTEGATFTPAPTQLEEYLLCLLKRVRGVPPIQPGYVTSCLASICTFQSQHSPLLPASPNSLLLYKIS